MNAAPVRGLSVRAVAAALGCSERTAWRLHAAMPELWQRPAPARPRGKPQLRLAEEQLPTLRRLLVQRAVNSKLNLRQYVAAKGEKK